MVYEQNEAYVLFLNIAVVVGQKLSGALNLLMPSSTNFHSKNTLI